MEGSLEGMPQKTLRRRSCEEYGQEEEVSICTSVASPIWSSCSLSSLSVEMMGYVRDELFVPLATYLSVIYFPQCNAQMIRQYLDRPPSPSKISTRPIINGEGQRKVSQSATGCSKFVLNVCDWPKVYSVKHLFVSSKVLGE